MPQIALIQSAAPQAPPAAPSTNTGTDRFSPHLDHAINSKKDQPAKPDNSANAAEKSLLTAKAEEEPKSPSENSLTDDQNEIFVYSSESMTPTDKSTNLTVAEDQIENSTEVLLSRHLFEFLSKNTIDNSLVSNENGKPLQNSRNTATEGGLLKNALTEGLSMADTDSLSLSAEASTTKPETDPFLLQLQKIIINSNESGKVSITVTGNDLKAQSSFNSLKTTLPTTAPEGQGIAMKNGEPTNPSLVVTGPTLKPQSSINILQTSTAMATAITEGDLRPVVIISTDISDIDANATMTLFPIGSEVPVDKGNQNLTSLRHSIEQQYFEGKVGLQNNDENQTTSENNQQGNTFSSKSTATGEGNAASTMNSDQIDTFGQPLALVQEGQKLPSIEAFRPITLPSGTLVQQEEVIRQITERMQIARRDNDTRINIQLHPAELGELKINLSVKDGTVRANVVASSQYAQDIIEKNMVKLRTILENQGFTIGEITVTTKSDAAGDFNLFDRQLFSQNDYTPSSTKHTRSPEALFVLEDPVATEQFEATGVNLQI